MYKIFWAIWALVYGADLLTKTWVVDNSQSLRYDPITIIDGIEGDESFGNYLCNKPRGCLEYVIRISRVPNRLGRSCSYIHLYFSEATGVICHASASYFRAICGGIVGNLTDRIFREPAEVVDFIDVFFPVVSYDYPVFNIADSGIFVGAITYFIWSLMEARNEKLNNDAQIS